MRENNYLVAVFVGGKNASLFFSEDLCELHVCRMLYPGCDIDVHDLRGFSKVSKMAVKEREIEVKYMTEHKTMPEQVVCRETKEIYPSLSVCAKEIGASLGDLMGSIAQLSTLGGRHYLMSSDLFVGKDLMKGE